MFEPGISVYGKRSAHLRLRLLKDRVARYGVAAGGAAVIFSILLIFFYLFLIVAPLAEAPEAHEVAVYASQSESPVIYLAIEEQAEIGAVFERNGDVRFISTSDGAQIKKVHLPIPKGAQVVSFSAARPTSGVVALGLSNGQALVVRHRYKSSYPNDQRVITPEIDYPLGKALVDVAADGAALLKVAIQEEETFTLVGWSRGGMLSVVRASPQESLLEDEAGFEFERSSGNTDLEDIQALLVDPGQSNLYVISRGGDLAWFNISDLSHARLIEQLSITAPGVKVLKSILLAGGVSILVASDDGVINQWFSVRDKEGVRHLKKIRGFKNAGASQVLVSEYSRKSFFVADNDGNISAFHTTADRLLFKERITDASIRQLAIAPRADALWALDDNNRLHFWHIKNEYPELSWSSLWSKVWYEGYDQPEYIWQSSAASNDFEPKLSLTPLTFGTLKAAFYAMLFAIPLSIMGAVFTAYFMAPKMRQLVKPTIEIMEALPTVILGFLAGLWLAPLVESHLPGIFSLLLLMPVVVLLAAFLWSRLPIALRRHIPDGWEAALLIPVLIGAGVFALNMSSPLEQWLFAGDMPGWLRHEMGISYDQRNSLVVGMAMGFAVIPTIFSIAEDAIFSVPKYLTFGSLALGATPWQTLTRVVMLTASPGIFSGIMMGVGRAVGETMIVLMATGNTPVMDMSIFQGMRTLSANIAVEMPEAEVGSTHYRVLFLAALVLFVFTFAFNTGAEIIRQRLRVKYSRL
ncbi:MAG TPA: ABC transporter permease subunit [Gammaproteobacteria bacterium]|nr:ABC transporter permease subunit [Gammaproteobacteria bacterium]